MREDTRNYVVVGSFVLAMLVALILWIALVSGRTGPTNLYTIYWDDVMGLSDGTQIYFQGYPVGLIEEIRLSQGEAAPKRFRVTVSVKRSLALPDDSVAEIAAPGLLSAVVINIQAGKSATMLKSGDVLKSIEPASVIDAIGSVAGGVKPILDKANLVVGQVNELLSPTNTGRIARILENLETTSANAQEVTAGLGETRRKLDGAIAKVDHLLDTNRPDLDHSIRDLHDSLEAVARHIDAISYNLEAMTRNMNEFSAQIRSNPGLILRGRTAGEDAVGGSR